MSGAERLSGDRVTDARGLIVGFVPGVTVTKWRRIWSERHPRTPLELVDLPENEPRSALDTGRVDMCFARQLVPDQTLHVIPLYEEVPVVVVPREHPASLYEEVSLADLADETVLDPADIPDAIDLVAGGAGVLLLPQSVARSYSRRDLVYRPVSDGTPTAIGLAWLVVNPHELIEEFIGIVRGRTPNSSRSPGAGASSSTQDSGKVLPPTTRSTPRATTASPSKRSPGRPRKRRGPQRGH